MFAGIYEKFNVYSVLQMRSDEFSDGSITKNTWHFAVPVFQLESHGRPERDK